MEEGEGMGVVTVVTSPQVLGAYMIHHIAVYNIPVSK